MMLALAEAGEMVNPDDLAYGNLSLVCTASNGPFSFHHLTHLHESNIPFSCLLLLVLLVSHHRLVMRSLEGFLRHLFEFYRFDKRQTQ